jgi:putative transposase
MGISRLAPLSDGRGVENLRRKLKHVAKLNRQRARRTKGGMNWPKTKRKLTLLHYHIACVREDILHKVTTDVAQRYGLVGVEDLHAFQNHCLALALADVSLGRVLKLPESKVPAQGGMLVKVGRFCPSSHLCQVCGTRLTLADRVFHCPIPDCRYVGDRDLYAAQHTLKEAKR